MVGQIKLFGSLKGFYRDMGIYSRPSGEKWTFNMTNLVYLCGFQMMDFSIIAYLVFDTMSVIEFSLCFYIFIMEFFVQFLYLLQMWQITNMSKFIEHLDAFIEQSKYKHNHKNNIMCTFVMLV